MGKRSPETSSTCRAPRSAASGRKSAPFAPRGDRQGLSAAFGDLHHAGASGARASRLFHRHLVAAPADRWGRACAQSGRAGETPLPAGISLSGAAARLARLPARDALAGVFAHDACLPSRSLRATSPPIADAGSARLASLRASLLPDIAHLHVHYLHTPGSVARYAAILTGRRFSFSAHAKDIWTTPDWEKREKIADAHWGVTCTRQGFDELMRVAKAEDRARLTLVYHGIDPRRMPHAPASRPGRDGSDPDDPVVLLSIGRLVAKKGFDTLLEAAAKLPSRAAIGAPPSSAPAPCAEELSRRAAAARPRRSRHLRGRARPGSGGCGAQGGRSLRAALPGGRKGRSRRASQRHSRGGLARAGDPLDALTRRCRNSSRMGARAFWSRPTIRARSRARLRR